jgi:hypothetical protein
MYHSSWKSPESRETTLTVSVADVRLKVSQ